MDYCKRLTLFMNQLFAEKSRCKYLELLRSLSTLNITYISNYFDWLKISFIHKLITYLLPLK